uniref:Metallophos domain-containing protein n=1 Tax=Parastrongyloides trichosuri TaxID=131310 RepID=A0A0N4ZU65_PARTI
MIADTHLLGPYKGHWFDKLRREWQMWRSFQTSLTLLSPDATFFLGDIFDEGQWSNREQFDEYINRFNELFKVNKNTQRYVVVGNHDIGFHEGLHPLRELWFGKAYPNSTPVGIIKLKNETFVLVNSMAMHGDDCRLCHMAEIEIERIGKMLKEEGSMSQSGVDTHKENDKIEKRPTVLMHFPLYRINDMYCEGGEELNDINIRKSELFREKWECLIIFNNLYFHVFLLPTIKLQKRVIVAGKLTCKYEAAKNVGVELWEIDRSAAHDVEKDTETDHEGNFYIDVVVVDYLSSDLELVIKIFHQCNVKDADLCYKMIEIPVPTTFFNHNDENEETYTPRAYNLGIIELDTDHPIQGKSCSYILGNTINRFVEFGSKFIP